MIRRIADSIFSLRRAGHVVSRRGSSQDVAVATIVAKNYLSFARALAESCAAAHPGLRVVVLLADEIDGYFDPSREPFELVGLGELGIPRLERFRFHYPQQPLSYASTPFLLAHLLVDALLGGYVALLANMKKATMDREMKLRYMPQQRQVLDLRDEVGSWGDLPAVAAR